MRQTAELKEIHAQALKRADEAWVFERDNIREGREDQRFYAGDQWDESAKKARGTDRPMLTINRLGTFVRQVTGDIRQNTPAIKVMPAGGPASEDKAKVLSGIIRSIEAASDAAACYEKGASNAAKAGQGWFRVLTKYCDETSFDQEICIEMGADPFGVLIDPFAKRPDKSDMGYGFVLERMSKEVFKAKYPGAVADDFPVHGDGMHFEWSKGESVVLAEYWDRKVETAMLYMLEDGTVTDVKPRKGQAVREREVEIVSIVSYMMSGKEMLSGPHAWAGKVGIPICFIPGEEETIEGATKRKGMVRDAKDPQRLVNYARTTEAEVTALQPKAPYLVTVKQIAGYEPIWKSAGTKNHPYLPFNPDPLAPALVPQRSQPPVTSSGLESLSMTAGNDLHDVIGIYPASLGAKSNETSGVAIRARQHEGDTGSNYIPDNTRRAIAYCGRILCELIPKIYDSERIVRVLKESGEHEMAKINAVDPATDMDAKAMMVVDSLNDGGKYDVVVSTGPSYATRQQEMAENMLEAGRVIPQIGQVAPDLFVKALAFAGSDELAARLKRTVPVEILGDDADPDMPRPQPNPKDVADARESLSSAMLKEAQTAKTLLEADAIAAQMGAMGEQLQQLTQLVLSLAQGGGAPPSPKAGAGGPAPSPQLGGNAEGGAGPATPAEPEIVDIEPIEVA